MIFFDPIHFEFTSLFPWILVPVSYSRYEAGYAVIVLEDGEGSKMGSRILGAEQNGHYSSTPRCDMNVCNIV